MFLIYFSHQVVKILNATDEHVMALGANFSLQADSHLVCIQSEQGYKTQAINIQNQARKGMSANQSTIPSSLYSGQMQKARHIRLFLEPGSLN